MHASADCKLQLEGLSLGKGICEARVQEIFADFIVLGGPTKAFFNSFFYFAAFEL